MPNPHLSEDEKAWLTSIVHKAFRAEDQFIGRAEIESVSNKFPEVSAAETLILLGALAADVAYGFASMRNPRLTPYVFGTFVMNSIWGAFAVSAEETGEDVSNLIKREANTLIGQLNKQLAGFPDGKKMADETLVKYTSKFAEIEEALWTTSSKACGEDDVAKHVCAYTILMKILVSALTQVYKDRDTEALAASVILLFASAASRLSAVIPVKQIRDEIVNTLADIRGLLDTGKDVLVRVAQSYPTQQQVQPQYQPVQREPQRSYLEQAVERISEAVNQLALASRAMSRASSKVRKIGLSLLLVAFVIGIGFFAWYVSSNEFAQKKLADLGWVLPSLFWAIVIGPFINPVFWGVGLGLLIFSRRLGGLAKALALLAMELKTMRPDPVHVAQVQHALLELSINPNVPGLIKPELIEAQTRMEIANKLVAEAVDLLKRS